MRTVFEIGRHTFIGSGSTKVEAKCACVYSMSAQVHSSQREEAKQILHCNFGWQDDDFSLVECRETQKAIDWLMERVLS